MCVVVQSDPAAVRAVLDEELARLLARLDACDGMEQVWLFGSALTGEVHATSDLDLLVVQRTTLSPVDRGLALRASLAPRVALDLFVFTPEEMEEGGRFVEYVHAHGRRLR